MREAVDAGVITADLAARLEAISETQTGLLDGTINPLSERANSNAAQQWAIDVAARKGLLYEGNFIMGARGVGTPGYANFTDRQIAMVNAYHYATELVQMAQTLAIHQTGKDRDPANYPMGSYDDAIFQYELPKSMLEIQFNLTENVVEKGADGVTRMRAFEVRHDTMGLMLSVDAAGGVTLYDAAGTAHSLEEYAAAQPDGYVPEVLNDLAIKQGKLDGRF